MGLLILLTFAFVGLFLTLAYGIYDLFTGWGKPNRNSDASGSRNNNL